MKRLLALILAALGIGSSQIAADGPKRSAASLQPELTNLALHIAKDSYKINLDFSTESIKQVEFILSDIHQEYAKTNNDDGLYGIALEFGAYIITTIEKTTEKGVWERNHPKLGEDTFPFYWKGSTLFPVAWCEKRIFDGEADDVWLKYQTLVSKGSPKK